MVSTNGHHAQAHLRLPGQLRSPNAKLTSPGLMTLHDVALQRGRGTEKFLPLASLDAELVQDGHGVALHDGPVALGDVEALVRRLHIQALILGGAAERLYEEIEQQLPPALLRVCILAFPVDA